MRTTGFMLDSQDVLSVIYIIREFGVGTWDTGQIRLPADWQRRQKNLCSLLELICKLVSGNSILVCLDFQEKNNKETPFELKWPNCISLVIEIESPTWACHGSGGFMRVLLSLVSTSLLGLHLNHCLQKSLCLNTIASLFQAST